MMPECAGSLFHPLSLSAPLPAIGLLVAALPCRKKLEAEEHLYSTSAHAHTHAACLSCFCEALLCVSLVVIVVLKGQRRATIWARGVRCARSTKLFGAVLLPRTNSDRPFLPLRMLNLTLLLHPQAKMLKKGGAEKAQTDF